VDAVRNGKAQTREDKQPTRLACFFALNRICISNIIRFAASC
jgi:hypothetical protein